MKYSLVRPTIKTGDILAWSEGSWKSWYEIQLNLVRMGTRSEWNHVGLAWVIAERVFVIEAVVPRVRIFPLSKVLPCYMVKYDHSDIEEETLLAQVGLPYSKWEAIKAFLGKVRTGDNGVWECAEVVNWIIGQKDLDWLTLDATPTETVKYALEHCNGIVTFIDKD
jgi:hypothetical protein